MLSSARSQVPSLTLLILLSTKSSFARPRIPDQFRELLESRYHYLSERSCVNPCGWAAQGSSPPLCCGSDQSCGTNSLGQAVCNAGGSTQASVQDGQGLDQAGSGSWTTTIIEQGPVTRTVTYNGAFGSTGPTAAAAQVADTSCQTDMGEKPCGTICCATGQYCLYAGQCAASEGDGDSESSSILGQIFTPAATNTAPLRPTSNAATTVTSTGSATTTVAFSTPSSAAATATAAGGAAGVSESSNNGLSGGAIAGIVIGVLAAIIILILLLIFCCAATVTDAILGFFGLRNRKRRRADVTYVEEHRHHHGSGTGRRRWFGVGPVRVEEKKKKKSNVGGLTAVAGGLTTLAVVLGLKRRRDKKAEKSEYGSSSYYSDYYSYSSELLYRLPSLKTANMETGSDSSRSDDRYTRRSGRSASRR